MTKILTSNIQIEIFMSDDKKERYILKKIWDIEKPIVTIITLYPSTSDLIINDSTTTFITNNVFKCGFGGFYSVNLYSKISTGKREFGKQDTKVNDNYILKCAKISDNIIIACGSLPKTNKLVQNRLNTIIITFSYCNNCCSKFNSSIYSITTNVTKSLNGKFRTLCRFS